MDAKHKGCIQSSGLDFKAKDNPQNNEPSCVN